MNYPGVLHQDPGCMAKLAAFQGRHIDGHAPLLSGRDLNGYIAAGIRTEHEATSAEEAREKLRKGLGVALVVAGTGMAYTPLMKQLESHPHFTVAQFAQAIGAVYYANS